MNARFVAVAALVGTYVLAIGIAGLWLVLPWWLHFGCGAVAVLLLGIVGLALAGRRPSVRGGWHG
jgi:hypothetical protein